MYKLIITILILGSFNSNVIFAQDSGEIDLLRIGYTRAANYGGGLFVGTEYRYNASPQLAIGIKADIVILGEEINSTTGTGLFDWDYAIFYGLTIDYKIQPTPYNTPFVGLAMGFNTGSGLAPNSNGGELKMRAGYAIGYVRFMAEYSIFKPEKYPRIFALTLGVPIRISEKKSQIRDF